MYKKAKRHLITAALLIIFGTAIAILWPIRFIKTHLKEVIAFIGITVFCYYKVELWMAVICALIIYTAGTTTTLKIK